MGVKWALGRTRMRWALGRMGANERHLDGWMDRDDGWMVMSKKERKVVHVFSLSLTKTFMGAVAQ